MEFIGGKYKALTSDQIHDIHLATFEVLEKTGVRVKEERALKVLEEAGADINYKSQVATIPSYLIEEAVKRAPKTIRLCGRDSKHDIRVEGKKSYFGLGGSGIYMLDLDTGERRIATKNDLAEATRLSDVLDNIDFSMGLIIPQDVNQSVYDRHSAEVKLKNTMKHSLVGALGADGAQDVIEMSSLVAGGEEELRKRPLFTYIFCTISPLAHDTRNIQTIMELVKHKAPIIIGSSSICGGTAPITIAGTLVVQNAEVLSGLLIAQLLNPGTPVLYGSVSSPMDMRYGCIVYGAPEVALLAVGTTQMAHYYGIPLYSTAGYTDSKIPDAQAAYEKTIQQVLVGLAGGNLVQGAAGMLDKMITGSLEQMTIDNEILGMIKRIIQGVEVNADTLAVDVINKVGPFGNYLGEKHTREHLLSEHMMPKLSDRKTREMWEKAGKKDVNQRANEMTKELLKMHTVESLGADVEKEFNRIIKEAEMKYGEKSN